MNFPAQTLKTEREWTELILEKQTMNELLEIKTWLQHGQKLIGEFGISKKLKFGYRALFHGSSGTDKTLAATLLGKMTGLEVFKIDLSMIISKYIGETEKNLATLFNKAENKNWILFFDEADALFGKRTNVRDAHDKYANQEVSYLLQRIENYYGLVILASNLKNNIDAAFLRRFNSVIHFPLPNATSRLKIWKNGLPEKSELEKNINLKQIAEKYELSGSGIMNVIQYASLLAVKRKNQQIKERDILQGVRKEFKKEGKII